MADKKEFTLKVNGLEQSIENVDRLVDNMLSFEQQTIKAISAQEVLQSVIEAQDPKKGIEKIIPIYQKLNNIQEHLLQMTPIGIKAQQEANEIVAKGIKTQIEGLKTIDKLSKENLDDLTKKEHALWKIEEGLKKAEEDRLRRYEKATDKEREELDKKHAKITADQKKKNNSRTREKCHRTQKNIEKESANYTGRNR